MTKVTLTLSDRSRTGHISPLESDINPWPHCLSTSRSLLPYSPPQQFCRTSAKIKSPWSFRTQWKWFPLSKLDFSPSGRIAEDSISAFPHPSNRPLCLEAPLPLKTREPRAVGEGDDSRKAPRLSAASNADDSRGRPILHHGGQLGICHRLSPLSETASSKGSAAASGQACLQPLGWLEGGGRRGGPRGGGLESCRPVRPVTRRIHQSCVQRQIWRWGSRGNKQHGHTAGSQGETWQRRARGRPDVSVCGPGWATRLTPGSRNPIFVLAEALWALFLMDVPEARRGKLRPWIMWKCVLGTAPWAGRLSEKAWCGLSPSVTVSACFWQLHPLTAGLLVRREQMSLLEIARTVPHEWCEHTLYKFEFYFIIQQV